ncbi:MAG: XRE family transcriptional regulator [Gemmataceae bacterium]|nr:XRE family transcriptional regulator [Gemmataceae bacterium]
MLNPPDETTSTEADVWEPAMPSPDAAGCYPALAAMAVSLVRDIIRSRRRLGLSQAELAQLARISQQTLDCIERGTNNANTKVVEKIEHALKQAQAEAKSE